MLAPFQTASAVWPIAADQQNLEAIVWTQMRNITANAALLDAYQGVLNEAQTPGPAGLAATGNALSNADIMIINGVSGTIVIGSVVAPTTPIAGFPNNCLIIQFLSGIQGGNGTYRTSVPTNVSTSAAFTFTPPPNWTWPPLTDPDDLMAIAQSQTAIIRTQTALLQQYLDLLNASSTPPPSVGP
jgi:hypothetical protein